MARKWYAVVLSALVVTLWIGGSSGQGQGGGTSPLSCGDVNGDGALNVADGIYTLNYLFLGGPDPQCLATCNPPMGDLCDELRELKARVPGPDDLVTLKGRALFEGPRETKTLLDVPDHKRFVVTSFYWSAMVGAKLVSVAEGNSTEIPEAPLLPAPDGEWHVWTSGFALPTGSDVGLTLDSFSRVVDGEYYINGYLTGE